MCGIAGMMDLEGNRIPDKATIKKMTDAIHHRGPDGEGFYLAPGIGLGHRRLAIIDLEGGIQPFHVADDSHVLSFNGEIYNYLGLAESLQRRGMVLKTRSDTEALAELWALKDISTLKDLRGMFAFGIWDCNDKTLTLARDRLGERPLYYAVTPDNWLLFGSEIGAILASGLMSKKLRDDAVLDYFAYGYVPDPKAIYKGIHKLPPGHYLKVKQGKTDIDTPTPWWTPTFAPDDTLSFEEAMVDLTTLLDEAVGSQMMSDVPLGAFLSGGVDSSAIVASMAKTSDTPVQTRSIGFEEATHDEREYAQMIATQYETNHKEQVVPLEAHTLIDTIAKTYGEPFADSSALPSFLVCKMARKSVTVALSGDGGDEIFAGYSRYPAFAREEKIKRYMPHSLRKPLFGTAGAIYPKMDWAPKKLRLKTTLQSLGDDRAAGYFRATSTSLPDRLLQMFAVKDKALEDYDPAEQLRAVFEQANTDDPILAAQYADLHFWLPGRMLTKVDRAAMGNSLEVRPPLLDYKLVEWAGNLPTQYKLSANNGKHVLKAAMEARLPSEILYRKKQGFGLPVTAWLRATENNPLDRLASSELWKDSGYLSVDTVNAMIGAHQSGKSDFGQELWAVLMFDAFLQS